MTIKDLFFALPQYLLPHHTVSRWLGKLTHCEHKLVKNLMIALVRKLYRVNMDESVGQSADDYSSFNAFFTRVLKPDARTWPVETNAIACPADGYVSQIGPITGGEIFQAKGKTFTAGALLGDENRAAVFQDGAFATIYLSPRDYHRMHMPLDGVLREMVHIPGRLFSVNAATTNAIPGLFAKNERVVAMFDTAAGPMALVLVGAIFVCGIETVWHGVVTPPTAGEIRTWHYEENAPSLAMGEEMGRFNMGSTIIVLFAKDAVHWLPELKAGQPIQLGNLLGRCQRPQEASKSLFSFFRF